MNELNRVICLQKTWDRGINAFYTSYYVSQYYSDYKTAGNDKSSYVNLNSGLNLLGWQLHSNANYTKGNEEGSGEWKSNTLYVERGIPSILGTLRAGDMYTGSDIFDAVRFRGVRIWRDMQMLPNSKQNFTHVVRGIAQSNALVTIEQNGFVIYQKGPPGPFAIDDLQLAGGGADLDVSVKRGRWFDKTYLVPYSSVPNMLQTGVSKYDFAAGRSDIAGASNQSLILCRVVIFMVEQSA